MAGPFSNFCGARSGIYQSQISYFCHLDSQVIRKSDPAVLNVTKCLANHLSSFVFVLFFDIACGLCRLRWTSEIHPMHTRNISSGCLSCHCDLTRCLWTQRCSSPLLSRVWSRCRSSVCTGRTPSGSLPLHSCLHDTQRKAKKGMNIRTGITVMCYSDTVSPKLSSR